MNFKLTLIAPLVAVLTAVPANAGLITYGLCQTGTLSSP